MKVELKFLADEIFLSKHDWDISVPEGKESVPVARIEGLTHLLNALLLILDESLLYMRVTNLTHFILQ